MDISTEIAAIQAASEGSELRQPIVDTLTMLNSGTLPAVTASDAGKILKVGANGWEVGEKSGYMPVPTATKQITENGTYDVTDFSSAQVYVSGGGGSSTLIPKTITQNGTYNPIDDHADGYSSVYVNVKKFIDPLDYLQNSNYYIAQLNITDAVENYYGQAIETVASFELDIGSSYMLGLGSNPGNRFRKGLFDTRPFTIIPSQIPTGTNQVKTQDGITVWSNWLNSSNNDCVIGNSPPQYFSIGFNATKRYLALHLSLSGQTPDVYLVKLN